MGKSRDITGIIHGELKVLYFDKNSPKNRYYWVCQCSCGNLVSKERRSLFKLKHPCCGCKTVEKRSAYSKKEMLGKKFGKLTVVKHLFSKNSKNKWLCQCDCSEFVALETFEIKNKRACRVCKIKENKGIPKNSETLLATEISSYSTWEAMRQRCNNSKSEHYGYYGGRGISVCEEWNNFWNFYRDMGDKPEGMSLDRINTNLGYFKENCRWTTRSEQSFNTRKQHNNTSGRTGVVQDKRSGRWHARISFKGVSINLGSSMKYEDAVKLREEGEIKYFGYIKE